MKQERLLAFQNFLVTQMNYWILFSIAVTVIGLIGEQPPLMWQWALCSLVPLAFFGIRRYTNGFLLFAAGHAAVAAVFFLLPYRSLPERLLTYLYVLGFLIYSLYVRIKTTERTDAPLHPGFAVGIAALALLLQHYQGHRDWDLYYVIPLICFFGLYYIQLYLEEYRVFMVVNDSSTGRIPQREMFISGVTLAALFSGGAMLLLLLTSNVGWVAGIASVLKTVLSWILRLFASEGGEEEAVVIEESMGEEPMENLFPMEEAEPFFLWQLLEKLVIVLMYCAVIALAIFCIYKLITFLHEHFQRRMIPLDASLEAGADVREKCQVERRRKERRSLFEGLGAAERIRRIYKKEIWSERKRLVPEDQPGLLRTLTPGECGKRLDRRQLTQIYEKARYSDRECTAEDVKRAREKI